MAGANQDMTRLITIFPLLPRFTAIPRRAAENRWTAVRVWIAARFAAFLFDTLFPYCHIAATGLPVIWSASHGGVMAKLSRTNSMVNPAHLTGFERIIVNGGEWRLASTEWMILQLTEGIAYAFDNKANTELPLGGVIICPPKTQVTLTASVLGRAVFMGMGIRMNSMMGFLTALERQCLETDVARECAPFMTLPADHPLAKRVTVLFSQGAMQALSNRLAFAQMFAEMVGPRLHEALQRGREEEKSQQEGKERLRELIGRMSESELAKLSIGDVAQMLHCCERHASRLFREEWGTGFLAYVSNLRLKKSCELLRDGKLKIIDVALESGHGSLSNFNFAFKKHYRSDTHGMARAQPSSPAAPGPPAAGAIGGRAGPAAALARAGGFAEFCRGHKCPQSADVPGGPLRRDRQHASVEQ